MNKDVCKKCKGFWTKEDERRWGKRKVFCDKRESVSPRDWQHLFIGIEGLPPKVCPFYMEHVVLGQKEDE